MSHEGILLIARAALVAFLIFATAVCRALVGPNRKRSEIMMLGTLGGMALGVFAAYVLTPWLTSMRQPLPRRSASFSAGSCRRNSSTTSNSSASYVARTRSSPRSATSAS